MPHVEASQLYRRYYGINRLPRILNWQLVFVKMTKKNLAKMEIWVRKRTDGKCNKISPIIPTKEEIENYGLCTLELDGQNVLGVVVQDGIEGGDEDAEEMTPKKHLEDFMVSVLNIVDERCKRMEDFVVEQFKISESKFSKLEKEIECLKKSKSEKVAAQITRTGTLQNLAIACEEVTDAVATEGIARDGETEKEKEVDVVATERETEKQKEVEPVFADEEVQDLNEGSKCEINITPTDLTNFIGRTIDWAMPPEDTIATVCEPSEIVGSKRALLDEKDASGSLVAKRRKKETEPNDGSIFTYPDDMDKLIERHSKGLEEWLKKKNPTKLSAEVGDIVSRDFFRPINVADGWLTSEVSRTRLDTSYYTTANSTIHNIELDFNYCLFRT